jgi:hypothetical protein
MLQASSVPSCLIPTHVRPVNFIVSLQTKMKCVQTDPRLDFRSTFPAEFRPPPLHTHPHTRTHTHTLTLWFAGMFTLPDVSLLVIRKARMRACVCVCVRARACVRACTRLKAGLRWLAGVRPALHGVSCQKPAANSWRPGSGSGQLTKMGIPE